MAIIYSYPLNDDIKPLDELVGTTEKNINGQLKTVTRNFLLQDLAEFFIVDGGLQKTIILTTEGDEGPSTLDQVTGILNIPQYAGFQNLQEVTDLGNVTTNSIIANSFITIDGIGANVLLDNGSTTPLSSITGTTNLSYTPGVSNGTVNSDTGTDATIPLAGATNAGLFSAAEKTKLNSLKLQNLQEVTDIGASTTNPIIVTALGDDAITAYAGSGTAITGNAPDGTGIYGTSINGDGVAGYSETAPAASFIGIDKGIKVTAGNTFVVELNQGLTSKGLVINSGTSSTGNFIELDKNGVDKLTVNQQGTLAINTINANGLNINTSGADSSKLAMAITSTISDGTAFACYSYGGSVANYIYSDSGDCVVLQADYPYGLGLNISSAGGGLSAYSIAYPVAELYQALDNKGLVINSGTSSTGNFIELNKNGIDKLAVNQEGELSVVKIPGGTSSQFLKADGSVDSSVYTTAQNLQQVTTQGASTTIPITVTGNGSFAIRGSSTEGNGVEGASVDNSGVYATSTNSSAINAASINDAGIFSQSFNSTAAIFNTISGATIVDFQTNNITKASVDNQGDITANSFIKIGGTSSQILAANGSVITAGTNITISGGTISSTGGGGGGIPHATASGTDTYTATVTGVASYADGDAYLIRFTNGNTTVATLNINALGAIPLYRNNDGPLIGGDVQANGEMLCVYNSTANTFQCIGTSPNSIISYVTNADSITITKGQVVYAFGGTGDRMTVKLASNIGDSTSAQTVGIVLSTSIAANQKGFIIFQGLLDNLSILPTATWADGDPVYLGTTAGSITKIKPYAPNHLVYIGIVTTASNGTAGRMYVRVQNGYELDELHNVQAQTPTLKDTLYYDNTVSPAQWKTASISSILGYTPANNANVVHLTGDETIAGAKTFTDNLTAGRYLYSGGSIFPEFGSTFYINGDTRTHYFGGGISNAQNNLQVSNGTLSISLQTANTIASFDANKNVVSLTTANGYPTLTELKSLVGVSTTAIQTQLNGKQPLNANLTSISALSISSGPSFVKVVGGVYSLDSSIYLTSVGIANLTATGTPSATTFLRGDNTWSTPTAPSQSAYTMLANNTNATAVPTNQVFRNEPSKAYTGAITPTASTSAPSGTTNHTYSWCQVGDLVTIRLNLDYASAGTGVTSLACMLPSDCPTPEIPSGVAVALNVISYGVGTMAGGKGSVATMGTAALRLKTISPNTFDIQIQRATGNYAIAYATIQYFV